MGVPKFYRWMSERYPCLSEVVLEHQIPEFDNLYLDMNGIIHNCSHPNDDDPHFRITEDQIFADIFHYIEFLFRMIKPQQVFFMAIDGVAPRAKMNQQRGRRFRTARDAELSRKQATERGEILPSESQFDSNCITPGTKFMANLHEQLKYFVSMKVSTDKSWQNCKIYLSGHETPGEGEHKIMDFIRYHKSQPGYNPNTRHCLYGLDADLMMLGLCSHEPHFSLLREEVKFGKKNQKRDAIPEQITFHLLHLSLMRDYICHEFQALKSTLPFEFDLERIIDDWVLMGFLVGNDFIPNLPGFHINKNALPNLYSAYIQVLPSLQGYINEAGFLNMERFQAYLKRLGQMDFDQFKDVSGDFKYLESKMSRPRDSKQNTDCASLLDGLALAQEFDDDDYEDMESDNSDETCNMEFRQHKRDYYITKMEYEEVTKEVLQEQATEYVRAIQWNLHYYYNGIVSWSWYYPHHYAPYISDVTDFSGLKLEFDMGKPFLPFQQLLGVLPEASKVLLPVPFQLLMTEEDSPLKKFYPTDFKTDQNGKQNEWEAVVLIPFIDEKLLVKCMDDVNDKLTPEEKERNQHGPHLLYTFSEESLGLYPSSLPYFFPDIPRNYARCEKIDKNTFFLPYPKLKKGLCPGVDLESYYPGFPCLKHLEHSATMKKAPVMVFQTPVRNETMILTLKSKAIDDLKDLSELVSKSVYIGWPHLKEAMVQAVTDGNWKLKLNEENRVSQFSLSKLEKELWRKRAQDVQDRYIGRWGINTGPIDFLVEANVMNGRRFVCGSGGMVTLEKQWSKQISHFALQAVVQNLADKTRVQHNFRSVTELFPPGLQCFHLGQPHYGLMGIVGDSGVIPSAPGKVPVKFRLITEPNFSKLREKNSHGRQSQYFVGYQVAQRLGISSHLLSRFTGTFFVQTNLRESMTPAKVNVGLNLKFNKKNEEIPGYSRRGTDGNWMYSLKTIEVMSEYLERFSELFDNVNVNLNRDYVHVDDLFPNGKGKTYIQEVQNWLKELPCSHQAKVTCGAKILDPALVEDIEQALDNLDGQEKGWTQTIVVDAEKLYRPMPLHYTSIPDSKATFNLLDRVVNVRQGYAVPLGLRGTIIGIPSPAGPDKLEADCLYDVLFDEEFVGGVSLLCCSKGRGYRLPSAAFINLSYGENTLSNEERTLSASGRVTVEATQPARQIRSASENSYAKKILQPPRLQQQSTNQRQGHNGAVKGSSTVSVNGNGMVRLERAGTKPRRRVAQEPVNAAHHFNHSPHSPFVPHLLSQGGGKANNFSNNPDQVTDFVTPKAPTTQSWRRTPQQQQPMAFAAPLSHVQKGGSEDEFTSIWEEMKQSKTLAPKEQSLVANNVPGFAAALHVDSVAANINSQPRSNVGYHKKVSIDDIMKQAKAAEEAEKLKNIHQSSVGNRTQNSAVMDLMQLVSSTIGGLPAYKYHTFGPIPLFSAVLTLPDGRTFSSSKFEANKDLASENAAEQALLVLRNPPLGSGICNIRPPMPAAFQSGHQFGSPSLNAAAMMLPSGQLSLIGANPLFPAAVRGPTSLLSHNNKSPMMGVRGPAPPPIYNIPQSFVAHNQMVAAASQWEAMQSPRRHNPQRHLQKNPAATAAIHLLSGQRPRVPPSQEKQNMLNPVALEFVPTQVARKQAGSKLKEKQPTLTRQTLQKTPEPVREVSAVVNPKPVVVLDSRDSCAAASPSDIEVARSPCTLTASPDLSGSSAAAAPKESVLPHKKPQKSRLAVKFSNQ